VRALAVHGPLAGPGGAGDGAVRDGYQLGDPKGAQRTIVAVGRRDEHAFGLVVLLDEVDLAERVSAAFAVGDPAGGRARMPAAGAHEHQDAKRDAEPDASLHVHLA
jgi:hypothetical protein